MKSPVIDPMLLQSAVMGEPAREGEAARAADFAALPWRQILERAAQLCLRNGLPDFSCGLLGVFDPGIVQRL
ncbi:hypothetical protein [Herbaspirillum seropedicae]|uniref:hypothetical protein n=1 Tax=Herbaspirillum seropedicae TaxID=964 RepID=UPI003D97D8B2